MRNRYFRWLGACCLLSTTSLLLTAQDESQRHNWADDALLFQASTLDALSLGLYQGVYSIGALKRQGDFGLGTFEGIDGEMTILNGHFYHFHSDGIVTEEPDNSRIPFAVITRFSPERHFFVDAVSMDDLNSVIDRHIRSTNLFYAIRVTGNFAELTTRAVPKLFPPYPPLSQALEEAVKFPFQNVNGTMVAFRCPAWVKGINQVGYHYHFISEDRTVGGHALSFTTGRVMVEIQELNRNSVWVPDNGPFLSAPLPVTQ